MVQRIQTLCDYHLETDGDEHDGKPRVLKLDGHNKERYTDLCDEAYKVLAGPLADFLNEHGRMASGAPARAAAAASSSSPAEPATRKTSQTELAARGITCPECGGEQTKRSAMRDHMRITHGLELAVVENERGKTLEGLPINWRCKTPGCGHGYAQGQALASHRRTAHGQTGANGT